MHAKNNNNRYKFTYKNATLSPIITNMTPTTDTDKAALKQLGENLKQQRLARDDRQEDAAARLGLSPKTYRKMENGDPSTSIGSWLMAIRIYGDLDTLNNVLTKPKSLFEREERPDKGKTKSRASRR